MQHLNNLRQRRGSTTSTTCSTPPPHDIYTVLISEENRYIRKGYGLISAILIAVSFMVLSPQIAQYVWPSFLELYEWSGLKKWQMTLLVLWFWHSSLAVITNLVMWAIYRIELPFFERYKISQDPWPWYDNREEWNKLLKKSLAMVSFNNLVSFPLAFLVLSCIEGFDTKLSYKIEDLPDTATLMCSIAFCMICEDFAFHHIHKILHWRIIYPYIHKLHHTYVMPIGISAEYSHPLEFIFGVLVPSGLGSMILGEKMHFATFLLWVFVRIGESLDGHSGYEFSWSPYRLIPFSTSASYHNFHHSHNVGNFSSFFSLWDTIFGCNKAYYQFYERVREAKERHDRRKEEFNKALKEKLAQEELESIRNAERNQDIFQSDDKVKIE